ncbi:MAG: hypothetical protein K2N67_01740 [Mucispirillum sp.]|nr:hypothetical protein [Mucispirillum sp.]
MINKHPSSFRDNSGYVFTFENAIYRFIDLSYEDNYRALTESGLYNELTSKNKLVKHTEEDAVKFSGITGDKNLYKIIRPERIPFISYPYEWCFSQLKAAALLTLDIQLTALEYGMTLKDASAYNIQFLGGSPVFIDTLSFEKYRENSTWKAYSQFCRHFLAPLAVIAYKDYRLHKIIADYIDGIPPDLAVKLLPVKSAFNIGLLMHLYLNAGVSKRAETKPREKPAAVSMPKNRMKGVITNLMQTVKKLEYDNDVSGCGSWKGYYSFTNYSESAFNEKIRLVTEFINKCDENKFITDIGANNGLFSRVAADALPDSLIVSSDMDFNAVEENFRLLKQENRSNIHPLIADITNPAAAIGWGNTERSALLSRISGSDIIMALALIHHIAITNNVPLENIGELFAAAAKYLIIEWVPKDDSQTQIILGGKEDIFSSYNMECFEKCFSKFFHILEKRAINGTKRTLYLMKRK